MRWTVPLLLAGCLGWAPAVGADERPADSKADEEVLKAVNQPADGPALLDYFRKRTLPDADGLKIQELITQLGDDAFAVREKASAGLVALGTVAQQQLRQAVNDPDVEVARRAEKCLGLIKSGAGAGVPAAAARLLAMRKPAGAAEVLLAYLPFADNEIVAREVRTALAAVALTDGKPDPALEAALADKSPVRRLAAVEVLGKIGGPDQRGAVRKLLKDPDPGVRLGVGLNLAAAGDKDAVPVLIELLAEVPQPQGWEVVDFLTLIAEDQAPPMPPGTEDISRQKCRDAWAAWWAKSAATVDLARLDKGPRPLGYTLIVLLDLGVVMELGSDGKPRWQFSGVQKPLDVQLLPGDHVLLAEHDANLVTERTTMGKVVWKHEMDGPLVAQRLPNGNTFMANSSQFLEIDGAGKEVFSHSLGVEQIMRAQKLPNGDIACVTSVRRFLRLDATGKELHSFPVTVQTSGGRIDVLPNGRVLIPSMMENRVVEYDPDGRAIWEAAVDQPIVAARLPNGHTLATSMNQKRAVELDRTGKEVWEYRSETRVTRALRR